MVAAERSRLIAAAMRSLIEEFRDRHDREPKRREVLRLRQQATLATRPEKTIRPLGELIGRWRTAATNATGRTPDQIAADALVAREDHDEPDIATLATATIAGVQERRSTWTRANLLAEAARASRHHRVATPAERIGLLDPIVTAALDDCVALDPPDLFSTPHRFRRADGASVFARPDEHAFTTTVVLDAEDRLVAATADTAALNFAA